MPAPRPPRILRPTDANLARLASALRRGEIVGVPSETVYGLAADALSEQACTGIFEAKGRPTTDPLIVHLASVKELPQVSQANETALTLARALWPGPLTLVLPKNKSVPDIVTAGRPTVAVRIPAHPLFRKLIKLAGRPLAAPSANPFGYVSPTTAAHVRDGLAGTKLRYVLDGGECRVGVESTIIDLVDSERPRLLRPGGLAVEEIEAIIGIRITRPRPARIRKNVAAPAPGMLARHYSPRTPIVLHERIDQRALLRLPAGEAALLLRRPALNATDERVFWLSDDGRQDEIARNLFSLLRQLDTGTWRRIHAEFPAGAEGLAPAIRDRLTRAAARR
jgi:L-threonylcarbamoyladenylate synthase